MIDTEVTFRTAPISAEIEELIDDQLEGFIAGHGDVTLVTVSGNHASSPRQAALNLASRLIAFGVEVHRVEKDLVTASTIASRCKISRAAVGNWARGDRRAQMPFPLPYSLGPQVWRWADVNAWLAANGKAHDTDVTYLSLEDEAFVDYNLAVKRRAQPHLSSWTTVVTTATGPSSVHPCLNVKFGGAGWVVEYSSLEARRWSLVNSVTSDDLATTA